MNTYQLTTNKNIYNEVLDQLYQVRKQLKKARFWGVLDIFGGGLIITYIKRHYMKKAMKITDNVQHQMTNTGMMNDLHHCFEDDDLLTAFDYLVDGLASDVLMERKILKMKDAVESLIEHVEMMKENA